MTRITGALALTVILALTACAGEKSLGESSGADGDITAGVAKCLDVWVDGKTLPNNYEGCTRDDGDLEAPVTLECDSGDGTFTTFDDRFYALLGGTIRAYSDDEDSGYAAAYTDCFTDPS